MKDRAWIEEKLKGIRQQKAKLLADFHAHEGAEQLCLAILSDDQPATDLSALTAAMQAAQTNDA